MKTSIYLLGALLGLSALGMGDKTPVSIRFYAEANPQDTDKFATPIHLENPPRDAYIEKIPVLNERMIKAIYPFKAPNGTWGCAFKLDHDGRIGLEVMSSSRRGTSVVAMLSTKAHSRILIDMLVDKPIRDGVISIPYGFTELEIAVLSKEWPVIGAKKKKK
ncbi:MAG: hypothetical protein ABJF10_12625 [Chthoniobacter sp.]|uniref:hypothetical protein n=1 Tax=Chthoniobacter sp. TaxID=2510640 RepID=UPI0032A4DCE5